MGELARRFQELVREDLAARTDLAWETERRVAGTPVDVVGEGGGVLVVLEVEWRRADPADNAAKLFRHLVEGAIDADRVLAVQAFTRYYDLADGGVSAKRRNAEFVGGTGAERFERLSYVPLTVDVDPPKRGGEPPADLPATAAATAAAVAERL